MRPIAKSLTTLMLCAFLAGANAFAQQLAPMLSEQEQKAIEQKYPSTRATLVDPSKPAPQAAPQGGSGGTYSMKEASDGRVTLQSSVKTLDAALKDEAGIVDWYGWYLSARNLIANQGGINCALGTPIRFYRSGRVEAMSYDPMCQISVSNLSVPLPKGTSVDVLILPTRRAAVPPASPDELYNFLKESGGSRFSY